jgi:hypothetical protein
MLSFDIKNVKGIAEFDIFTTMFKTKGFGHMLSIAQHE